MPSWAGRRSCGPTARTRANSPTAGLVLWFENDGKGHFRRHTIDDLHGQEAYDLKIADLDGDGRRDILLAGRRSRNVVCCRNRADKTPPPKPADATAEALAAAGVRARLDESGRVASLHFKHGAAIPDAAREALVREGAVREVNCSGLDPAELKRLAVLPALERLTVGGAGSLTDEHFAAFAGMKALRELSLHHIRGLTGAGFEHLVGLPKLELVKVHHCHPFADAAYPFLTRMPALRELELTVLDSTTEGLKALRGSKTLTGLDAGRMKGDDFLESAGSLLRLRFFQTSFATKIRPAAEAEVSVLAAMGHLDSVRLYNLELSEADAAKLRAALPSTEIEIRRKDEVHGRSVLHALIPRSRPRAGAKP